MVYFVFDLVARGWVPVSTLYIIWFIQKVGLDEHDSRSNPDCVDEQPLVVVLKPGDLTAEEVSEIEKSQIKGILA